VARTTRLKRSKLTKPDLGKDGIGLMVMHGDLM